MDEKQRQGIVDKVFTIIKPKKYVKEDLEPYILTALNLVENNYNKIYQKGYSAGRNEKYNATDKIVEIKTKELEKEISKLKGQRGFYDKKYQEWSDTADMLARKIQRLKRELSDKIGEAICPNCKSLIRFRLKKK